MESGTFTSPNKVIDQSTWQESSNVSPTVGLNTAGDSTASTDRKSDQLEQSSTEERKRAIWDQMRMRMENRRKDWNIEVERLKRDFFQPKPAGTIKEAGNDENRTQDRLKSTVCEEGSKFRVCFDLSSYQPEEICVRTEERKLVVYARHEEKSPDGKRTATKEFSRQVDIPKHVQPEAMRCTLTRDGLLQVEADVVKAKSSIAVTTPGFSGQKIHSWTTPAGSIAVGSLNVKSIESPKMFCVSVNIGQDFEPEDLTVQTVDRKLVVSARREVMRPGNASMREFHREFDLPDSVDPTTVTANMTEDGCLLIEAPLQPLAVTLSDP